MRRKNEFAAILLLNVVIVTILHFYLRPLLYSTFSRFGVGVPRIADSAPEVSVAVIVVFLGLFLLHNRKEIPYKTERLETGDIKVTPQEHASFYEHLLLIFGGLLFLYLVIAYLVPVYILTRFVGTNI